ncbi:MAG: alanine--tRNA ligase [Deltaproteobacteria bacterium]|nr:alanine--tRNA ligase [Deltaproteobacteria bacterium]
MKSAEIRERFLKYFAKAGHEVVSSSGLIPKGDPTLLFTNAGMVQFKGVFLLEETRPYKTAVSCQRCVRAGGKHNDLENVGVTARHHTFFEMLGNFSFGDYFKEGAIEYAWAFLTSEMGLPKDKLWVTVFETDDEAARIWADKAGVAPDRIVRMGAKDNFWAMGDTGPCGPCSEILIDQGPDVGCGRPGCAVGCDCDRYLELWNLVFMQYNRGADGTLTPLPKPCIDTGMGLERLTAVMQGKHSNYSSDIFMPIIRVIEELTSVKYGASPESDVSIRAIADHARAITFLITDGVLPGNVDRAYVLRRIIRRAARHGRFLGMKAPFIYKVNSKVIELLGGVYPEAVAAKGLVMAATRGEEERFFETLERGLAMLEEEIAGLRKARKTVIPGSVAFKLYDTYGFPVDLTADVLKRDGFTVDEDGFAGAMAGQKKKARASWKGAAGEEGADALYKAVANSGVTSEFVGYHVEAASSRIIVIIKGAELVDEAVAGDVVEIITDQTPFYAESGGQAGDIGVIFSAQGLEFKVTDTRRPVAGLIVHYGMIDKGRAVVDAAVELVPDIDTRKAACRNHTATHLLHAALRRTLGEHLRQAGSLVTATGLRFDFNHFEALSPEVIRKIEDDCNMAVIENIEVVTDVLPYREAIERGALAFFGDKYGETVRLVQVAGVSAELCGGTHVRRTGDIGYVKVVSEGSVASGVRRLEAVTGTGAMELITRGDEALRESAQLLKAPKMEVPEKIRRLIERQRELEREIEKLKGRDKAGAADSLASGARTIKGVAVLAVKVEAADAAGLRELADALRVKLRSGIVVLASEVDAKAVLLASVTKDLTGRFSAGEIVKRAAPVIGGKGGGKPEMAQAGGPDVAKLDAALEEACRVIEGMG